MMRKVLFSAAVPALAVAAALSVGAAAHAQSFPRSAEAPPAQPGQSYPRTYGSGDNIMVDYGPMGQGTLVGGGRVMVSQMSGENVDIVHLDSQFVQQPREGYVPLSIGSGETQETIWVPRAMVEMVRRARTTMPSR